MKAMVLAAGFGTRLGSITKDCPKCLIPVGGKPMIQHAIERLVEAGVTSITVNLHYLASQVEEFFRANPRLGVKVSFSHEPELLGTGGGLLKVRPFFEAEERFLMVNADIYCEFPLSKLVHSHRSGLGTLLTMERPDSSYLLFDNRNLLVGLENKAGTTLVRSVDAFRKFGFCGIQVLTPRIFDFMDGNEGKAFSVIDSYLAAAAKGEEIGSVTVDPHFWIDMGTPEQLETLRRRVEQGAKRN